MDQLQGIFAGISSATDLLVVPTCQHATLDLVKTGEAVDDEKDRLLERVSAVSRSMRRLSTAKERCQDPSRLMHSTHVLALCGTTPAGRGRLRLLALRPWGWGLL
jgi:hypothetical protein